MIVMRADLNVNYRFPQDYSVLPHIKWPWIYKRRVRQIIEFRLPYRYRYVHNRGLFRFILF